MSPLQQFARRTVTTLLTTTILLVLMTSASQAITLKIATLTPDGSMWMKMIRAGAEEIARKTDQRVKFKFYPGGVMGDDKAVMRKIRIGQLQGAAVTAGTLSHAYRDVQAYHLPILFGSLEEVDYVRSRMDATLVEGVRKGGFVIFGLAEGGFAYLMSKNPIAKAADLRRQKVWIPTDDPISLETAAAFDIKPIPLAVPEVRTALQTGLIDTVTISPIAAIALQWHTQVNYISDNPLIYLSAVLAIDRRSFDRISAEDQAVVNDVLQDVWKKIDRKNRRDNVEALKALQSRGIQLVKPEPAEQLVWKQIASEVPQRMIESGQISQEIVTELNNHLREFRSRKTASIEKK